MNRGNGCIFFIFEFTGWFANILLISDYIGFHNTGQSSHYFFVEPFLLENFFVVSILVLYGLIAVAALLWFFLYYRVITSCESFFGFIIFHSFITSVMVLPFTLKFELQITNIANTFGGLVFASIIIWLFYFLLSAVTGWFVFRVWVAPRFY